jgi:hypothetical protein
VTSQVQCSAKREQLILMLPSEQLKWNLAFPNSKFSCSSVSQLVSLSSRNCSLSLLLSQANSEPLFSSELFSLKLRRLCKMQSHFEALRQGSTLSATLRIGKCSPSARINSFSHISTGEQRKHQYVSFTNTLHPSIHSIHSTSKVFSLDFVSVICFCISNKQAKRAFQRSQPGRLQLPSIDLSDLSCLLTRTPLHKLVDSYQILVLILPILSTLSIVFLGVVCCLRNRELATREERLSKFSTFCISISQWFGSEALVGPLIKTREGSPK